VDVIFTARRVNLAPIEKAAEEFGVHAVEAIGEYRK
jgi:hypothetical protein